MSIITHNMLAMNANRQLNINRKSSAKSMEKLSSGFRINRAADDAAGLAISEKMRGQIRGLITGSRNAQDGISLCQVADGALEEVHNMIHRISELSVQAANGTNTDDDREDLQDEVEQILDEIDRIGETTEFNTIPLFNLQTWSKGELGGMTSSSGNIEMETVTNTYERETIKSLSVSVSGTTTDTTEMTYVIDASENQLLVNGDIIPWSEVRGENNNELHLDNPTAGTYSFSYHGMKFAFEVTEDLEKQHIIHGLDGIQWETTTSSTQRAKFTVNTYLTKTEDQIPNMDVIVDGENGLIIDDTIYEWSDFKHTFTGNGLDQNNVTSGRYNLVLDNGVTVQLVIDASNTASIGAIADVMGDFRIVPNSNVEYDYAVSDISGFPRYQTDALGNEFLKVRNNSKIKADEDGVWVDLDGVVTTKITWAELGIDVANPQPGTYYYRSEDGSMYFDFTVNDNSSMDAIIIGLNDVDIQYSANCKLPKIDSFIYSDDMMYPYAEKYKEIYNIIHFVEPDDASIDNPSLTVSSEDTTLLKAINDNLGGEISLHFVASGTGPLGFSLSAGPQEGMFRITDISWNDLLEYMNYGRQMADIVYEGNITLEFVNDKGSKLRLKLQDTRQDFYDRDMYTTSEIYAALENTGVDVDLANSEYTYSFFGAKPAEIGYGNKDAGTTYYSLNGTLMSRDKTVLGKLTVGLKEDTMPSFTVKETITETIVRPVIKPGDILDSEDKQNKHGLWIQSGANEGQGMWLVIDEMNTEAIGLGYVNISTVEGAEKALIATKDALARVSKSRSKIGAQQNRLEHTIAYVDNAAENLANAESRIRDTDMAEEVVTISKFNILQKAGEAMLAQANQSKQSILELLQG